MSGPEEQIFNAFVDAHARALLRLAFVLTGSRHDSEDLLQDTLMRAYQNWSKVQRASAQRPYVERILINEFLRGRRKRRVPEELGELEERGEPAREFDRVDESEVILWMLRGLERRRRTVLVLRYLNDRTDEEIAELLNCRRSTVRSLAKRGLDDLRQKSEVLADARESR